MSHLIRVSATAIKLLLGALFFFSATAKYVSLDKFELYIYSLNFFSQSLCFLFARLVIAGELFLGALLMSNRFHRLTSLLNTLLLIGFTIFLSYAHLIGRSDSCNCFGEILPFNPIQSILKNALLLLLTLFSWRFADQKWRPRWWIAILLTLIPFEIVIGLGHLGLIHIMIFERDLIYVLTACMAGVAVLSSLFLWLQDSDGNLLPDRPTAQRRWLLLTLLTITPFAATAVISTTPEDWTQGAYKYPFEKELFLSQIQPGGLLQEVHPDQNPKIVAFYSLHCTHCQSTAQKIHAVIAHNHLDSTAFVNVFMANDSSEFARFYTFANIPPLQHIALHPEVFVQITHGQFPLVVMVAGDSIYNTFSTTVPENEVIKFLNTAKP